MRKFIFWALAAALFMLPALARGQSTGEVRIQKPYGPTEQATVYDSANQGGQAFNVKAYGAKGNGATDDTAAIQAAWKAAKAVGGTLLFPPGKYLFSQTLSKPMSFAGPSIRGASYGSTILEYTGPADTPAIYYQGGSGRFSGIQISGFTLQGTGSQWGIEIDGQDGVTVRQVQFQSLALGFAPANVTRGAFTEGTVCDECSFRADCITALRYMKGPRGTNSFHGTGLLHSYIQANRAGQPLIVIDRGALPYNAPLSGNIWVDSDQVLIENNGQPAGFPNANFHGVLMLETGQRHALTIASRNPVNLAGRIFSFGPSYALGTLKLWRQLTANGTSTYGVPENTGQAAPLTSGANRINIGSGYFAQHYSPVCMLVYVRLIARNYHYDYLLMLDGAAGGLTPRVAVLANSEAFNSAGYGPPTFSIGPDNNLVITNPRFPVSGVTAYIGTSAVGASLPAVP